MAASPKKTLSQLFCEGIAEFEKQITDLKRDLQEMYHRAKSAESRSGAWEARARQAEAVTDRYCKILVERENLSTRPLIFMDVNGHTDQLNQEIAKKDRDIVEMMRANAASYNSIAKLQADLKNKDQQIEKLERWHGNQAETIRSLHIYVDTEAKFGTRFVVLNRIRRILGGN